MAPTSQLIILNSLFFSFLLFSSFSKAIRDHVVDRDGITTDLFHRDSPLSPFYDPSLSHYDRLRNAFIRSISRSKSLIDRATVSSSTDVAQSPLTHGSGEFLMHLSIGTPPVKFVAIADTGSDLTWTQCLPCKQCYKQTQPIFNPQRSSSYHRVPCNSNYCRYVDGSSCGGSNRRTCDYGYSYGDQSYTNGELGNEKITLESSTGRPFFFRNAVIGCGHENGGTFQTDAAGIIGLGGGVLSLVSQLNTTSLVHRQFSYCLSDGSSHSSGKISFGKNAIVSGRGVVSTPLIPKYPATYYYLTLEAISVGNKRLALLTTSDATKLIEKGNIIIDSGTTLTYLPSSLYNNVVSTLEKVIDAKRVDDPSGELGLCYATDRGVDIDIPVMTFHFTGADVKLQPLNTFALVADNVICLTLTSSSDIAIFGNLAQMKFLIGYDLDARRLSFQPSVCA